MSYIPYANVVDDDRPPPRRRRRYWPLILVLLIVVPLAGVALLVGLGALWMLTSNEKPVTADDRAVLITVDEVADRMDDLVPDASAETVTKTRYIDGSYELEYGYEHPDEGRTLYLSCKVSTEPTEKDARETYAIEDVANGVGFSLGAGAGGETTRVPRDDLFRWGDQSKSMLISSHGQNVGNFVMCRQGKHVFCLQMVGLCLDDRQSLSDFLMPALRRLESYSP